MELLRGAMDETVDCSFGFSGSIPLFGKKWRVELSVIALASSTSEVPDSGEAILADVTTSSLYNAVRILSPHRW